MPIKFLQLARHAAILLIWILPLYSKSDQYAPVSGMSFRFDRISVEDGLSQSTVYSIMQDSHGFMWFGTEDGLNRYDGYDFKVFKHDEADTTSLSQNYVWTICEDLEGYLWIGTDSGGLCRFDPRTETFTRYTHEAADSTSLSSNVVQTVYADSQGMLWIGTWGGGLDRYLAETHEFENFRNNAGNEQSLSRDQIWSLYEDSRHDLWIGTDGGGVNRIKSEQRELASESMRFERFLMPMTPRKDESGKSVLSICEDQSGKVWFGTYYSGLFQFDPETEKFTQYKTRPGDDRSVGEDAIWKVLEDSRGRLWVATASNGLDYFDRTQNRFVHYRNQPSNPHSISANDVRSLYEDDSGVLWIGTMVGGLNKIDCKPPKFYHLKNITDQTNSLGNNFVFSVLEDRKGNVWIGTYGGGLDRYNPATGNFKHYRHDENRSNSISSDQVRTLYEDRQGSIWAGTYFGGLNRYEQQSDSFVRYMYHGGADTGPSNENIRTIFEDAQGALWIGTNGGGINRFDHKEKRFAAYHPEDVNGEYVLTIAQDAGGFLWIGTYGGGLLKFDQRTNKFTSFKHDSHNPLSISGDVVPEIYFDSRGRMWVGTFGSGLNKFDPLNGTSVRYSEKNGLGGNVICGILEDEQGNLWVGTNRGVSCFNPDTEVFRNYDASDGLNQNEMNPGASFKSRNGIFYFGGVNGLNFFRPEEVTDNPHVPPVVLTSFEIFGKPAKLPRSLSYLDEIRLSYKQRFFSFEFASLDYTNSAKNKYAYKLEEFNDDWIDPGKRRYASYTHLDPGDYVFRVKGSNNDGVWNEEGTSIKIRIVPPFWQTWWFRLLTAGGLIGLVAWSVHRRVRHLKQEKQAQEVFSRQLIAAQENERKRIAAGLHDSIGQELLIINNGLQQCLAQLPKDSHVKKDLKALSEAALQSIHEVRDISANLHPHQLERLGLTKAIESMLTKVRQTTALNLETEVNRIDGLLPKETEINVYRIVQESLNNILKHAEAKNVVVHIEADSKRIAILVRDDGKGFDASGAESGAMTKTGFGLKNMSERVKILDGTLTVDSQIGKGTEMRIRLPFAAGAKRK